MDDDDYWNTSETKARALSFDDDVLSPQEILAIGQTSSPGQNEESIFSNVSISSAKSAAVPLSSLISSKVLDLIILAQSGQDPAKATKQELPEETVPMTLRRLTLGRNCSLHVHRSLKSKTELLDGALAIGDGNAILTVILFLIQTLNKKLVYGLLSSRPIALNHYISFLHNEGKIADLEDLLTKLGQTAEAAMYQFQQVVKSHSGPSLHTHLVRLLANQFNEPKVDPNQMKMVADYIKLLEWEAHIKKPELNGKSVIQWLAYYCSNHWHEGAGNAMSPLTLCQRHQISPLQYDWVVLNVHAKSGKWDIVESLFTKKDWLGRTTVSSHIPIESLLARLNELQASKQLMAKCLDKVAGSDDRLRLAHMYKVHSVVIETMVKQKDRAALTNYKMTLSPQSEEYILAENNLRNASVKWKN